MNYGDLDKLMGKKNIADFFGVSKSPVSQNKYSGLFGTPNYIETQSSEVLNIDTKTVETAFKMPFSENKTQEKPNGLKLNHDFELQKKILWANKDAIFGTPLGGLFSEKVFPWPMPPGGNPANQAHRGMPIPIRNEVDPDYAGSLINHSDKNILGF